MSTSIDTFLSQGNLPVIAAPMFLVSGPQLVIECCKAGIIGTFPALNQRTTDGFDQWLTEIRTELDAWEASTGKTAAPFGVNLIVHQTNPRVQADLAVCAKHKVPLIITSLGAVSQLVDAVHSYGGVVYHDIIKKRHAEKAAEAGVDGLILVCAGAGGHAGTHSPFSLLTEVRSFYDGKIILSGAISTGRDVATALQLGADLAYMGTRFIATTESRATTEYKDMIIRSGASDIVYTAAVSGVPANFLKPSLESMGISQGMWEQKAKVDFGKELDAAEAEAKAWKTIWSAGQGVTAIHESIPVADLVNQIKQDFLAALSEQATRSQTYTQSLAT